MARISLSEKASGLTFMRRIDAVLKGRCDRPDQSAASFSSILYPNCGAAALIASATKDGLRCP